MTCDRLLFAITSESRNDGATVTTSQAVIGAERGFELVLRWCQAVSLIKPYWCGRCLSLPLGFVNPVQEWSRPPSRWKTSPRVGTLCATPHLCSASIDIVCRSSYSHVPDTLFKSQEL